MAVDWDNLVIGPTVSIFGDTAMIITKYTSFEVIGVFDEGYLELTPLGRGGDDTEGLSLGLVGAITSERPVLGIRLSLCPVVPVQGDLVTMTSGQHKGERFAVKECRPDGHGHAKLLLNEYRGI